MLPGNPYSIFVNNTSAVLTHLTTTSHCKLLECLNVIDEQIHQSKLVIEAHQDVQARRVQGNTVSLLWEHFV